MSAPDAFAAAASSAVRCRHCNHELTPGSPTCPYCLHVATERQDVCTVYELPQIDTKIPAEWQPFAVYGRETPVACPLCREPIQAARIGWLARTQGALLSELPRKGRERICPECERVLFAELSELVQNADTFRPAHVLDRDVVERTTTTRQTRAVLAR